MKKTDQSEPESFVNKLCFLDYQNNTSSSLIYCIYKTGRKSQPFSTAINISKIYNQRPTPNILQLRTQRTVTVLLIYRPELQDDAQRSKKESQEDGISMGSAFLLIIVFIYKLLHNLICNLIIYT